MVSLPSSSPQYIMALFLSTSLAMAPVGLAFASFMSCRLGFPRFSGKLLFIWRALSAWAATRSSWSRSSDLVILLLWVALFFKSHFDDRPLLGCSGSCQSQVLNLHLQRCPVLLVHEGFHREVFPSFGDVELVVDAVPGRVVTGLPVVQVDLG